METAATGMVIEFVGGPYDGMIVSYEGPLAAITVFDLEGEFAPGEGHAYWVQWGRLNPGIFVYEWDPDFT